MEINKVDLDNYITGHWGEDQFRDDESDLPEPEQCSECGKPCYSGDLCAECVQTIDELADRPTPEVDHE